MLQILMYILFWRKIDNMVKKVIQLILCHLIGDYFLQIKYIAETKGKNWYHLFVHCALYCIPFIYFWGYEVQIIYIFVSHFIIDLIKSRYKKIIDVQDQSLHYVTLALIEMISPL